MSYRSWLKDVKSIHDLGEHCHNLSFRKPEDETRDMEYDEKWLARQRRGIPVAEEHQKIFGGWMHDSWVEWVNRSNKELRLRLNSIVAQQFLYDVAVIAGLGTPEIITPVELVFEDPVYVNAVRSGPQGELKWSSWEDMGRLAQGNDGDQFLRDWFFQQDDRIQWIAEIWAPRAGFDKDSTSLYLLVDGKNARADDLRGDAITKAFTPEAAAIWSDWVVGIETEGILSPASDMQPYIERRMKARNIERHQFRS